MSKDNLTIKKFLLKKFPTSEYMDCPLPKHHWETIEEYAAEKSKQEAIEFKKWCDGNEGELGYAHGKSLSIEELWVIFKS